MVFSTDFDSNENKIIKNNSSVTTDNLYRIDENSKEWTLLKSDFINSRLEMIYQLKKIDIGLSMIAPLGTLLSTKS